jgi:hypothetical protein
MSIITTQFDALRSVSKIISGHEMVVTIREQIIPALVSDAATDEIIVAGGIADSGGIKAAIKKESIPQPVMLESVTYNGRNMRVLSWTDIGNECWELTCGTPER